jgi:hypothetical protein
MPIYYSSDTKGFYNTDAVQYTNLPNDCIEITETEYNTFIVGLYNGQMLIIEDSKLKLVPKINTVTWDDIRNRRKALLESSDHTQTLDWPGDKAAWTVYRQALRDIPQTFANPADVIWPTAPGE